MKPGSDASDEAVTKSFPPSASDPEAGTLELVLHERPADPRGAARVLANLERRMIGDAAPRAEVARYVLLQQIGSGGLGVVYGAYDPELDRRIALKFLHARGDDSPRAQDRLVREAKAMAKLSHPNVVTVYDVGTVEGQVFIAMELVDGVPLSTFMRAKQRDWRQVRSLMVQAGKGLMAAHQAGLVHRDFKPQNVLVGSDGRARVLDFGLARLSAGGVPAPIEAAGALDADDRLTQTGTLMGTPAYMSPEQIQGSDVGPAADQFAFCVAMFEGLYGARPFVGSGGLGVIAAIREGRITPPKSTRDVPAWLHRAVMKGLSQDPEQRFASMRALLEAITKDQRARRTYGLVAVLVAVLLGAVFGAGLAWFRPGPTPQQRAEIEARVQEARAAAEIGDFVYPPAGEPERDTAYTIVRALERVEGGAGALAREQADVLRTEFGAKLVELGDAYWGEEGGAPFAGDYYASALIFDAEIERARERASLTRGELRGLAERAEEQNFSSGELLAAQSLALLADPDPQRRAERLDELTASERSPSPTTTARLQRLVRRSSKSKHKERASQREPPTVAAKNPGAGPGLLPPPTVADPAAAAKVEPAPSALEEPATRPKGNAATLTRAARQALSHGKRTEAKQLFNQAIRADRKYAPALGGLAQLHFDAGQNHKAVTFGRRAVSAAPRNGSHRVLLGDALVKVLDYDGAKKHYTKAQSLGHGAAGKRLALLRDKLGE